MNHIKSKKRYSLKSLIMPILPLILGSLASGIFLYLHVGGERIKFDELALGRETAAHFSKFQDSMIHGRSIKDVTIYKEKAGTGTVKHRVLWLGNSQMHGVNQYKKGQENMVYHLFRRLKEQKTDLLGFSQPNANLGEHYIFFEYVRNHIPFDTLLLPVVFDDFRNIKIREDIADALMEDKTAVSLASSPIGKRILDRESMKKNNRRGDEFAGVKNTMQEKSERFLNKISLKYVPFWRLRKQARGSFFHFLYKLRNTAFNITAQTKRPLIKERYNFNMAAFKAILDSAKEKNITVLVYIAPIRHDVELPYIPSEYDRFKKEIRQITEEKRAFFINLEKLIPGPYWGSKGATGLKNRQELDFMHFKEPGHILLAKKLGNWLTTHLF